MADEYVGAIEDTKSAFRQIIDSWNFLEDLAEAKMGVTGKALSSVATILAALTPLGKHHNSTLRPMAIELAKAQKPLGELLNKWVSWWADQTDRRQTAHRDGRKA